MIQHFHGSGKEECWRGNRRKDMKANGESKIFYLCDIRGVKTAAEGLKLYLLKSSWCQIHCSSAVLLLISYIHFSFLTFSRGFLVSSALITTAISQVVQKRRQKMLQGKDVL